MWLINVENEVEWSIIGTLMSPWHLIVYLHIMHIDVHFRKSFIETIMHKALC